MRAGRASLAVLLILVAPLATYFVPFAYASTTQSTYVVVSPNVVPGANSEATIVVKCSSPSDSALHFFLSGDDASHGFGYGGARVLDSSGAVAVTGENPNGFEIFVNNYNNFAAFGETAFIICQSPITVAGVGVPEFGQLYLAIALGAMVFFFFSRRYPKRNPGSGAITGP